MSTPTPYHGWINVRLRCVPNGRSGCDRPRYDLSDREVADRATLDLDEVGKISGAIVHDCTDWEASREGEDRAGRLVLFCQVEIEADSEQEALDALDEATAFVPGYAIEEWSTVPAAIDAD